MTTPPSPSGLLRVSAVMARYGLRDPRAARRLMHAAGGFVVAGRLHVRPADLLAHEDRRRSAPTTTTGTRPAGAPAVDRGGRRVTKPPAPTPGRDETLPRDWWKPRP